MPQVYLVVHDNIGNYLITKKRCKNSWWNGKTQSPSSFVNQAGQWALPGGEIEAHDETATKAALREFKQETAIDLIDFSPSTGETSEIVRDTKYIAIEYEISSEKLIILRDAANSNVQPNPVDINIPNNRDVCDWELAEFKIVHYTSIRLHLGERQAIPFIINMNNHILTYPARHAVDWYGTIARACFSHEHVEDEVA